MKKLLGSITLVIPIFLFSQKDSTYPGIEWTQDLSWEQLKRKAKTENKFIFLDCYATWCGPCKLMDRQVYSSAEVGKLVNNQFISVKVQMDSTSNDSPDVKRWYSDAKLIAIDNELLAFPTFLFYSPGGKLLLKEIGFKSEHDFLALVKVVLSSDEEGATYLKAARMREEAITALLKGQRDSAEQKAVGYSHLLTRDNFLSPENISFLQTFISVSVFRETILDFKRNFLDTKDRSALCEKNILAFVEAFPWVVSSGDSLFYLFTREPERVDKIAGPRFSEKLKRRVITKEEITDKLWSGSTPITQKPKWRKLKSIISRKYGARYANELILEPQLQFYKTTKNWHTFARLRTRKIKLKRPQAGKELFDPEGTWVLNDDAWTVFRYSQNRRVLRKALRWVELAIHLEAPDTTLQMLDTRANLLYKLGKKTEAIEQEQLAIDISNAIARKSGAAKGEFVDEFLANIDKMKRNDPTWEVD